MQRERRRLWVSQEVCAEVIRGLGAAAGDPEDPSSAAGHIRGILAMEVAESFATPLGPSPAHAPKKPITDRERILALTVLDVELENHADLRDADPAGWSCRDCAEVVAMLRAPVRTALSALLTP